MRNTQAQRKFVYITKHILSLGYIWVKAICASYFAGISYQRFNLDFKTLETMKVITMFKYNPKV